jgi:hypothetical protein
VLWIDGHGKERRQLGRSVTLVGALASRALYGLLGDSNVEGVMPVEMGLWRIDDKPVRLLPGGMPTEARLEELIEADPAILGEPLLIIGRQVPTSFGKVIDLLAIDTDGVLHVLELKTWS